MPAIEDERDIDIGDVALLEGAVARNAVADHMVERDAGGMAIAAIADRG